MPRQRTNKVVRYIQRSSTLKLKPVLLSFTSWNYLMWSEQRAFLWICKSTYSDENTSESSFYNKLSNVLSSQNKAYKFIIQHHCTLIDRITKKEFDFFASDRTSIYDTPISINSKRDISKTIDYIKSLDKADKLSYPSSSAQLKTITGFKIVIYHRQHELGTNVEIPKAIKQFPDTNNNCILLCIAYTLQNEQPERRKMICHVKEATKSWRKFKNVKYTTKYYKEFQRLIFYNVMSLKSVSKWTLMCSN